MKKTNWVRVATLAAAAGIITAIGCAQQTMQSGGAGSVPRYQVDAYWPKPLQDNWIWGQVSSVSVDSRDHVWVLHRPATLLADDKLAQQKPPTATCCVSAPPVMEFDPDGKFVRGWGGPGEGYDWPKILNRDDGRIVGNFGRPGRMAGEFRSLHNIAIDSKGNIYTAEAGFGRRVQKFKLQ